jgi:predicted Fe-Mo cluster-binding NifX family protein
MKTVAISASGKDLDSFVEPRFGRTRFFILVDPATEDWESLDNMANLSSLMDVGILTAKNLTKNRVVETVVTGHCGPKAFKELHEAGVKVFLNARGSLRHVLNKLRLGELKEASGPNVPAFGGHER